MGEGVVRLFAGVAGGVGDVMVEGESVGDGKGAGKERNENVV